MDKIIIGGTYSHYKTGKLYEVLCIGKHSESLEDMVVYKALYDNPTSNYWIRPLNMFSGTVEYDGRQVNRFSYTGVRHFAD